MNKQLLLASSLIFMSSTALANIEYTVGGGQSSAVIKGTDGSEDISVKSPDISIYLGYHFKSFPLSIGLYGSKKNFDLAEKVQQQGDSASSFYEDPSLFPTMADITSSEASGSWSGIVFGPQLIFNPGWRYFDPYLRLSYQVGTLKSSLDFKSTGNYMGDELAYDFSFENDFKATILQYGLGFRIPMGPFFVFADYAIEKMTLTSESITYKNSTKVGGATEALEFSDSSSTSDSFEGQVLNVGLGLSI